MVDGHVVDGLEVDDRVENAQVDRGSLKKVRNFGIGSLTGKEDCP